MEKVKLIDNADVTVNVTYIDDNEVELAHIKEICIMGGILILKRDYLGSIKTFVFNMNVVQSFEF